MPTNNSQLDLSKLTPQERRKIEKLAKVIGDGNLAILEHLFELEETLDKKIEEMDKRVSAKLPDLENVLKSVKGNDGYSPKKGVDYVDGKDGENYILTQKDKSDISNSIKEPLDKEIKSIGKQVDKLNLSTDSKVKSIVTQLSSKINTLKTTLEDLALKKNIPNIDDIRSLVDKHEKAISQLLTDTDDVDIKKEIDDLKEKISKIEKKKGDNFQFVGSPGSGGKVVKIYDLSPYLNGVTKTFSLPAFWRITSIQSSSAPFAFIPTTDYTIDYSGMKITFTSQIEAASTLQTGQTVIVLYAEN